MLRIIEDESIIIIFRVLDGLISKDRNWSMEEEDKQCASLLRLQDALFDNSIPLGCRNSTFSHVMYAPEIKSILNFEDVLEHPDFTSL